MLKGSDMQIGVADYGMSVWDGGNYALGDRLARLKDIGYEGIEMLTAATESDCLWQAAEFRRRGMNFASLKGPRDPLSIQWAVATGCRYIWSSIKADRGTDMQTYCRRVNSLCAACEEWGLRLALHNHLGQRVQNPDELETFLQACPDVGLVFDTGHCIAAGGDPAAVIREHPERLLAIHVKDWFVTDPSQGLDAWQRRGRFCELGAGNTGYDHGAVFAAIQDVKFDGWIFVEHDTHLRDPIEDLRASREFICDALGF